MDRRLAAVDPYRELGVDPGAPPDELRRAYRERVRRLHPDSRPEPVDPVADEELRRVTAAWDAIRGTGDEHEADPAQDVEDAAVEVGRHPRLRSRIGIVVTLVVLFLLFVVTAYAGSPTDEEQPTSGRTGPTTVRGGD